MILKLLFLLYNPDFEHEELYKRKTGEERRAMIIKKVRKEDGTILTPEEQLSLFSKIAQKKGDNSKSTICHLFKHNNPESAKKLKEGDISFNDVVVCQISDNEYAVTSTKSYDPEKLNRLIQKAIDMKKPWE